MSTQGLLSAPNPDDPLDNNVAEHWKRNEADAVIKGELVKRSITTLCRQLHVKRSLFHQPRNGLTSTPNKLT